MELYYKNKAGEFELLYSLVPGIWRVAEIKDGKEYGLLKLQDLSKTACSLLEYKEEIYNLLNEYNKELYRKGEFLFSPMKIMEILEEVMK